MEFISKVIRLGNSFAVIIPKNIVVDMGIEKGDYVKIELEKVLKVELKEKKR